MQYGSCASEKYALVHFPKKERNIPTTPLYLHTTSLRSSCHASVRGLILVKRLSLLELLLSLHLKYGLATRIKLHIACDNSIELI